MTKHHVAGRGTAEFDLDGDGHLTAEEATTALHSRGVMISLEHMKHYIDSTPPPPFFLFLPKNRHLKQGKENNNKNVQICSPRPRLSM